MKNRRTNHEGLAAVNLRLNNGIVMTRYYIRKKEYAFAWPWIKGMFFALFTGWTLGEIIFRH